MKKNQKFILATILASCLTQHARCNEFKFPVEISKEIVIGAICGAAAGLGLFKIIDSIDKWHISSKQLNNSYLAIDTDLPTQVKADFETFPKDLEKLKQQNDRSFKHQHSSLLYKLVNKAQTWRQIDPKTHSITPQITYDSILTRRKAYNGIKAGFVLGSAIVGAYVLGNIVQK